MTYLKVLKGGYDSWKEAGYPVETGVKREVLMLVPSAGNEYMLITPGGRIYGWNK